MITAYIVSIIVIFLALLGWILAQHMARLFAARHSEFGPAREEGGGCSLLCLCKNPDSCSRKKLLNALKKKSSHTKTINEKQS